MTQGVERMTEVGVRSYTILLTPPTGPSVISETFQPPLNLYSNYKPSWNIYWTNNKI